MERIYTVPLGDAFEVPRNKRVPKAVKLLREFISKHMKATGERILISEALNKSLWERSIQKPPRKIKIRVIKEDGTINAYLSDEVPKEKPKEKKSEEKAEPKKEEKKIDEKIETKKVEEKPKEKVESKKEEKAEPKKVEEKTKEPEKKEKVEEKK
ncbi:50S ribosomal protein L31e [Candidatus Micrarchaeota archaeon]|nr:50S ribosomal protein L31e [Candidatus Micrarchaeota archaeon]